MSAGNYSFSSYPFASGQLHSINQNQALFSLLGTNYRGNGVTSFARPNLNGRTPMGMGGQPQPSSWVLGAVTGSETAPATIPRMPTHEHTAASLGVLTGSTGGGLPIDLMQPSLAMRYLIATNGDIPSTSVQAANHMIGQIQLFAGFTNGTGWAPCEGQLLFITNNPALFNVISNTFGGDGISTFALPDLAGRIPVGAPTGQPGASYGNQQRTLTIANLPAHSHSVPVLDFDRWISSFGLTNNDAAFYSDADGDQVRNGFEWATGSNPTNSLSAERLKIGVNGAMAELQFSRNTNATDVTFFLQRSTDLSNPSGWSALATNSGGAWIGPVIETGSTNPLNVIISDPRTNPAAHYRLQLNFP
jgi:microcystin-dependent protein